MRNLLRVLLLSLITILKVQAPDTHFIPAPKALFAHELPFDEKNQTKFTLRGNDGLIIPGATKLYHLKYVANASGANMDSECTLAFKSEIYERKIMAGEAWLLTAAPVKVHNRLSGPKAHETRFYVKSAQDTEVPLEYISCNLVTKNGGNVYYDYFSSVSSVNCLFEVRVRAPLARSNPSLDCSVLNN